MNLRSIARDLWLLRTFRNGRQFVTGLRTGRLPNEAVFLDGYVLKHPPELTGLTEVLIEVLHEQVYTPSWFYKPSPNDMIVDFGANVGVFSIGEVRRNRTARVVAIEAHPRIFKQLQENVAQFSSQIQIYQAAVQRTEGSVQLGVPGARSLDVRVSENGGNDSLTVPAIDFSRVVSFVGDGEIALLKCDIEGAEAEVFEGAKLEDLKKVRRIALEYHDNIRPDTTARLWGALGQTHRLLHLLDNSGCGIMLWARRDLVHV